MPLVRSIAIGLWFVLAGFLFFTGTPDPATQILELILAVAFTAIGVVLGRSGNRIA